MIQISRTRIHGLLAAGLLMATALTGATAVYHTTPVNAATAAIVAPNEGFAGLVEKVMPAVVSVEVKFQGAATTDGEDMGMPEEMPEPFKRFFGERPGMPFNSPRGGGMAQGSGFFISADGYAVTNNHVVQGAAEVTVRLKDGGEYAAKVIGTDPKTDLALIKVDAGKTFDFVPFAREPSRAGDWVIAIGNPFGLGGSVSVGVVSALGRDIGAGPYDEFMQIDATINKGNSGGPAFNSDGEVVGVNTAIFSPSGGSVGIGFAIPAALTQEVIDSLKNNGAVTRGYLGVQIQPVTADLAESLGLEEAKGAIVSDLTDDSPAEKAGIKTGDTILKLDGRDIADSRDLAKKVSRIAPGKEVELTILRGGKTETLKVALGTMPLEPRLASKDGAAPERAGAVQLGPRLAPAPDGAGVQVVEVKPGSPAAKKGLKAGDIILEVAGNQVNSAADVREAVAEGRGKKVLMLVKSGDAQRFVAVDLDRG